MPIAWKLDRAISPLSITNFEFPWIMEVLLFLKVSVAFPGAMILKFPLIIPLPVKFPVEVLSNGWGFPTSV